jgi:hypothetical protein
MWHCINQLERMLSSTISRLDTRDWLVFLAVVVAVGIFCMRGYGSRKNY